jgi:predicted RNase H-like HicB family nuclease
MPVYKVCVFYSAEDDGYIAVMPDLPGCSAFGDTREEPLKEIRTALSLWLETAREIGKEIPPGILSSDVHSVETILII